MRHQSERFEAGIPAHPGRVGLRTVVMYLIGVGLYSVFIKPLNLMAALWAWWIWEPRSSASSQSSWLRRSCSTSSAGRTHLPRCSSALRLPWSAAPRCCSNGTAGWAMSSKEHALEEQEQAAGELFHGDWEERTIKRGPTRPARRGLGTVQARSAARSGPAWLDRLQLVADCPARLRLRCAGREAVS